MVTHLVHRSAESAHHVKEGADQERRDGCLLAEQTGQGQEQGGSQGQPLARIPGLAPPHVSQVAEVREQVADAGGHVRPTHHSGHRFRVNWVGGEEGAGGQNRPHGGQKRSGHSHHQGGGHTMEQIVDQVEAPRRKSPADEIVQPEAEHAQRSPRAVGSAVRQRSAPEVVREAPLPGSSARDIRIRQDGASAKEKEI